MSRFLLPRDEPRSDYHAADAFDHLRGAFAAGFLLEELLRHVEFGPCVLLVRGDGLRKAAGEVGPPLAQVACDGYRVDDVAVLVRIQERATPAQRVVNLFGGAGFVVVQRQEVPDAAPEIQAPLRQLVRERRGVGGGLPRRKLRQRIRVQMLARDQGLDDIEPFRHRQQVVVLRVIPVRDVHDMAAEGHGAPDHRGLEAFQPRDHIGVAEVSVVEGVNQGRILGHKLAVGQEVLQSLFLVPTRLEELVHGGSIGGQEHGLDLF